MRFLTLPFRIALHLWRAIFFSRFLQWIFRSLWIVYLAGAVVVANLAYKDYLSYNSVRIKEEAQISAGPPDPVNLSAFDPDTDISSIGEINVVGMYFPAFPGGSFESGGLEQGFIAIANERGSEVKAVLVVRPAQMTDLWESLDAQGEGDRIQVTVNGRRNISKEWAGLIDRQLRGMGVPVADDIIVIMPFIGPREAAIRQRTDDQFVFVVLLAGLATILAFLAIGRLAGGSPRAQAAPPVLAPASPARPVRDITPDAVAAPVGVASPWGGAVGPRPDKVADPPVPVAAGDKHTGMTKPASPAFVSVFPGGGSGFRFKTADEIIRETFGTVSVLTRSIDPPKD